MNWRIIIHEVRDRLVQDGLGTERGHADVWGVIDGAMSGRWEGPLPRAGENFWLVTDKDFRKHILKEEEE